MPPSTRTRRLALVAAAVASLVGGVALAAPPEPANEYSRLGQGLLT